MKKSLLFFIIFSISLSNILCFEWPNINVTKSSFQLYYGQKRGPLISSSLIFSDCNEVSAIENGRTLIIFEEEQFLFPSTLGSAVIIGHDDNLASVYGNLDKDTLQKNNYYDSKAAIGQSGNSGWKEKDCTLELQILDFKNSSAINPFVLLPRTSDEFALSLSGIKLRNKNGSYYDISENKTMPAGTYKIYSKRNEVTTPYKTSILVNGVLEDELDFDSIIQDSEKIFLLGKKRYSTEEVYPNENLMLLGEVTFTPGKSTLVISISTIKEAKKSSTINLTIY